MANAIAASVVLEEHWFIDAPLFVSGVGYESAAGKGLRGAHKGSIKDAKQLSREAEGLDIPSGFKQWFRLLRI